MRHFNWKNASCCVAITALLGLMATGCTKQDDGPVGILLGKEIPSDLRQDAGAIIFSTLTEMFIKENEITVSSEEIDAFISAADKNNPSPLPKAVSEHDRKIAESWISTWKVNKALYEKYGGRISFQQTGPEPVDAYTAMIMEHRENGTFAFYHEALEAQFLNYFTNPLMAHIMAETKEEADKIMATPFWEQDPLEPVSEPTY